MVTEALFSVDVIADPFTLLSRFREEDPVHWIPDLETWLVTRHADVTWIVRHPELFSSEIYVRDRGLDIPLAEEDRPLLEWCNAFRKHEFIQTDPPEHDRMRAVVRRPFSPRHLEKEWREPVRVAVARLLDAVELDGSMDVMRDLAKPLPFLIIAEMLGIPEEHRALVREHADKRLESLMSLKPDRIRHSAEGIRETSRYLDEEIDSRLEAPRPDLLGVLADAQRMGRYSRDEVQANAQLLIDAGFVTTTDLICNGTLAFLRHPDQWEVFKADPEGLAKSATEECLRLDPPVPLSYRIATCDVELLGKQINEGQRVTWAMAAANRDPRVFSEPDSFDIRRSPNPHVSFGAGIHFCLGHFLARIEGQEVFKALARRFPSLRLTTESVEYEPVRGVHHLKSLPVVWD
jgi:cytochrome P450